MGNTKQEQTTNEIVPVITEIKDIGSLVYVIRGKQVMIDSDLQSNLRENIFIPNRQNT